MEFLEAYRQRKAGTWFTVVVMKSRTLRPVSWEEAVGRHPQCYGLTIAMHTWHACFKGEHSGRELFYQLKEAASEYRATPLRGRLARRYR